MRTDDVEAGCDRAAVGRQRRSGEAIHAWRPRCRGSLEDMSVAGLVGTEAAPVRHRTLRVPSWDVAIVVFLAHEGRGGLAWRSSWFYGRLPSDSACRSAARGGRGITVPW